RALYGWRDRGLQPYRGALRGRAARRRGARARQGHPCRAPRAHLSERYELRGGRAAVRRYNSHGSDLGPALNVRVEALAEATCVIPEGRLDFDAAPGFQQALERALAASGKAPAALIIDGAALEYVSSAGLRAVLLAARAAQRAGVPFALCGL